MKREDLVKVLVANGWTPLRSNGHEIWCKAGHTNIIVPHKHGREINRFTAKAILRAAQADDAAEEKNDTDEKGKRT